jgi:hypothetical protein
MTGYKAFFFNVFNLARYNMRIIFGGKLVYFILAALLFFLVFGTIMAFEADIIQMEEIFGILAFPAVLLVFYPSVFGIQNDADQRTLEIIFGIPDYRYKIWLVRLIMVLLMVFVLLFPFAGLAYYALMSFPIFKMILQLMVLVTFTATLSFAISTIVKNGNATAVIMVVLALILLILTDSISTSKWNVLLNPFNSPSSINEIVWRETVRQNRLFMGLASSVFLLIGLLNLQNREKFLR